MRNRAPCAPPADWPWRPPCGRKPSAWSSPRGGLPELISHGRNGWIAREPSADALAETLRTALEEEERWPSMGAHGQQLLSSTYSPAAWLQSMGSLLEELRLFRQSPNIAAS